MERSQLEAYATSSAEAIGLPLDPAHLPGVLRYLGLASHLADQVMGLPLGTADEPAERFEPIGPDDLPAGMAHLHG